MYNTIELHSHRLNRIPSEDPQCCYSGSRMKMLFFQYNTYRRGIVEEQRPTTNEKPCMQNIILQYFPLEFFFSFICHQFRMCCFLVCSFTAILSESLFAFIFVVAYIVPRDTKLKNLVWCIVDDIVLIFN